MAETLQKPKERLQPALLDRLTDDEPGVASEGREKRVLTERQLRQAVLRDLGWLLSTANLESRYEHGEMTDVSRQTLDSVKYPEVARSVLNYGSVAVAGLGLSGIDTALLEQRVRQAILTFEPRLLADTVTIKALAARERMSLNALVFTIDANLWAQPLPLHLYIRTEIDVESGETRLQEAMG